MSMPIASHASSLLSLLAKCSDEERKEKENKALVFDRYKDKVAILPMEKGWMTENMHMYQGFWYS
ncbi:hypothetical protein Hanom_Chr01g00030971 [Helianthus anomalus]